MQISVDGVHKTERITMITAITWYLWHRCVAEKENDAGENLLATMALLSIVSAIALDLKIIFWKGW